MELMHAGTYEEARREVLRHKESAGSDGPVMIYRIVKSPYAGFTVYAFDADLYAEHVSDQLFDGLPSLPGLPGSMNQWKALVK